MKKYLAILKKCPLFYNINEESLVRMLGCLGARVESFDRKYTIFPEGMAARYLGIVLSGSVQTVYMDYYGNRSILSESSVGEIFAESCACAEVESMPVSVVANEPCEIMLIDCSHILHTCHNNCGHHQQLIYNLMKDLATKSIMFYRRIEVTSKRTTRDKLMAYLMMCAKSEGRSSFRIPFDRQELADYLEVDRSGLSAEISKLRREGVIENTKDVFKLL